MLRLVRMRHLPPSLGARPGLPPGGLGGEPFSSPLVEAGYLPVLTSNGCVVLPTLDMDSVMAVVQELGGGGRWPGSEHHWAE